jgi:hypothetical protein
VDPVHLVEAPGEEVRRARRRHDLDLVPLREQLIEDDSRSYRVPHPLTDDAVQDLHGRAMIPAGRPPLRAKVRPLVDVL